LLVIDYAVDVGSANHENRLADRLVRRNRFGRVPHQQTYREKPLNRENALTQYLLKLGTALAIAFSRVTTRVEERTPMENTERVSASARHRIEIKVSEQQKALIVRAAEIAGVGVSEFVRSAAERAARAAVSK
jgi:hypothetical protein